MASTGGRRSSATPLTGPRPRPRSFIAAPPLVRATAAELLSHCHPCSTIFFSLSLIFSKKLGRVEKDHPTGINLRGSLGFSDQENSRTLTPS